MQYGLGTAELTQVTTLAGGTLGWGYRTYTYSGTGLTYREVQTRQVSPAAGTTYSWNITLDNNPTSHGSAIVADVGAGTSKVWTFGTVAGPLLGLASTYEERNGAGTALVHKDFTWVQDTAGRVYTGTVTTTLDPGTNDAAQTKSVQTLDVYGNIVTSQVYDFGNLSTPARTYNWTYLHQIDGNYTARYIRNRVKTATVTVGGLTTTLVTNTYDVYNTCTTTAGLILRTGAPRHDDSYNAQLIYRGNLTETSTISAGRCWSYETTGVVIGTIGETGSMSMSPSSSTNYSLPATLTPEGNANLATSVSYAASFAVTSVTGPNGANGTTSYDSFGRPEHTKIPDGAETSYTYTYNPNTQTATLGTRWRKTTPDGFLRPTRVESGHDSTTVSQVDSQYAPCPCSPLGKLWRVSQPYAPGGTPVWSAYTYDARGRTLTVTAPDGSITHYAYAGNRTTVTDPAGKWKTSIVDAMGNLTQVQEPDPANGPALLTNYTYNSINQLLQVSMPRSNGTQTRTFVYSGIDMISANNPESGITTYEYGNHRVTKRTDAKGQETRYTYDPYGRLTQAQHWAMSWDYTINALRFQEQNEQRVTYYYDQNPLDGSYSQNTWGRLAAVTFHDFSYMYSYNPAGRVTQQHMATDGYAENNDRIEFNAAYSWDNEGRMTSIAYPGGGPVYQMTFDAMGRVGSMQDATAGSYPPPATVATATYGVAGEITGLSYFGAGESRTYNSMFQMTRQTVSGMMDMEYNYTAGANNGRIASSKDWIAGETVNYGYDTLNRLTSASATNGSWGQGFSYDGFGNLTGTTATAGSPPVMSVSFDPLTNRQSGAGYDANGNINTGGTYDVENRMVTQGSFDSYVYDPAGKRVRHSYSPGRREFAFYGVGGQKLETLVCVDTGSGLNCNNGKWYNVYFGGKLVKGKDGVMVTDRLGSVRANGNGERFSYYPYGEERGTSTADNREKFGTYTRDSPFLDYADQRYYGVGSGRFNTADPMKGGRASLPHSWNRYLYVLGDPINLRDPRGLLEASPDGYCAPEFENCDNDDSGGVGEGTGVGGGGGGDGEEPTFSCQMTVIGAGPPVNGQVFGAYSTAPTSNTLGKYEHNGFFFGIQVTATIAGGSGVWTAAQSATASGTYTYSVLGQDKSAPVSSTRPNDMPVLAGYVYNYGSNISWLDNPGFPQPRATNVTVNGKPVDVPLIGVVGDIKGTSSLTGPGGVNCGVNWTVHIEAHQSATGKWTNTSTLTINNIW